MEIDGVDITAGLAPQPLSDLLETLEGFFAPRIDLMDRRLRQVGGDLRKRAKRIAREDLVRRAKSKEELRGMKIELQKMRVKVSEMHVALQREVCVNCKVALAEASWHRGHRFAVASHSVQVGLDVLSLAAWAT